MTTAVWISLGSNVGDRRAILDEALTRLNQTCGVAVSQVSSFRETHPVGGPPGQGPFLNAAARLETTLTPRELLGVTQGIEKDLGRVRTVRWGERTLDLDLLIFGSKFVDEPDLKLPHPRLAVRRFVLEPLAEIAPNIVDTMTRLRINDLLKQLDHRSRLLLVDESLIYRWPRLHEELAQQLGGRAIPLQAASDPIVSSAESPSAWDRHQADLRKVDTLRANIPDGRADRDDWTVTNFSVNLSDLKRSHSADWLGEVGAADVERAYFESPKMWFGVQFHRKLPDTPTPTLIIAASDSRLSCRPGICSTPIYRPEATDPDGIVAEVVAVCRGIEGV